MGAAADHIAAWEAAHLIDSDTAARLRAAEADRVATAAVGGCGETLTGRSPCQPRRDGSAGRPRIRLRGGDRLADVSRSPSIAMDATSEPRPARKPVIGT